MNTPLAAAMAGTPFFFDPLHPFCADLIVADPAWTFVLHSFKGAGKSAQEHYSCMDGAAIRSMPVGLLAGRDCWLFLWVTAPLLDLGIDCLKGWGFTYKTFVVWRKVTRNGKPAIGTGYLVRGMAELVLIGCFGEPHYAKPLDGLFDGVRREHSRKPDEFYERLERFAPQARKVDLFARQRRPGWTVWGNEVDRFDGAVVAS